MAGALIVRTQARFDLALAGVSALVLSGTVFNMFSAAAWFFELDRIYSFGFGMLGIGLWLFALAIFYFFMSEAAPRHAKRR